MNHELRPSPSSAPGTLDSPPAERRRNPEDAERFLRLYQEHGAMLLRVVRRTGVPLEAAEDVCQEVWLMVHHKLDSHFDGANFRAWLCQSARNRAIDWFRRSGRDVQASALERFEAEGRSPQWLATREAEERHAALLGCVEGLPDPRRSIVRLRLESVEVVEIARQVGLERAQVDRQFHAAKQQLLTCLTSKGFGEGAV